MYFEIESENMDISKMMQQEHLKLLTLKRALKIHTCLFDSHVLQSSERDILLTE